MLGRRSNQRGLFEGDLLYLDFVGPKTFYGFLSSQRDELFKDEDFAELYCADNGRRSVPPSLLCTALVLQHYDKCSDEEAWERASYDLRWKVALGTETVERPFAKEHAAAVPLAQLLADQKMRVPFERSLELGRRQGLVRASRAKLALDPPTSWAVGPSATPTT